MGHQSTYKRKDKTNIGYIKIIKKKMAYELVKELDRKQSTSAVTEDEACCIVELPLSTKQELR